MTAPPLLTIIIVTYNSGAYLADCLNALTAAGAGVSTELILVDNASARFDHALLFTRIPAAQIICNGENVGFARAVNQGIARAAGRYILLLNPDAVLSPGSLAALAKVLEARPDAAAVSPLLLNADGSPQFCWARFPDFWSELMGRDDRSQSPYPLADFADADRRDAMTPFAADWIGGACLMMRKSVIDAVGPLDGGFFLYGEETEWCHRAKRAGNVVLVAPHITVMHGSERARLSGKRRQYLFYSRIRLYRKLHGPIIGLPAMAVAATRYALSGLRRGRE